MVKHTRRVFLATSSLATAGSLVTLRGIGAQPITLRTAASHLTGDTLLPEPATPMDLRALGTAAMDAARQGGASYADIRVAERHSFSLYLDANNVAPDLEVKSTLSFGIRVIADGGLAFVHGTSPTIDSVTTAAREAMATARGYAKLVTKPVEFLPLPSVTGEWSTPMKVDPFTVPLEDQAALLHAYNGASTRVYHAGTQGTRFQWTRETRVFAASNGTLLTQQLRYSEPMLRSGGDWMMGAVNFLPPRIGYASGGYETVMIPGLQDDIKATAEEVARLARLPRRAFDVGRYPVVLDGATFGTVLGTTLGPALELDRVLGDEADASGTSFVSPPMEQLGRVITSSALTVTAHRNPPSYAAVKWDDDGTEAHEFPLVQSGRLVDYITSRSSAPALQRWYEQQGQPLRSHGCAVAGEAGHPVLVRSPHLTVAPAAQRATLEDLYRDIPRGLLIRYADNVATDQQLSSGSLTWAGAMFEIEKGKIVRRIDGNGIQFGTSTFWKSLMAVGDANTTGMGTFYLSKGQPWRYVIRTATAPAGFFKDVNVISTKVRL